jgi:hypothetical protein
MFLWRLARQIVLIPLYKVHFSVKAIRKNAFVF